MNWNRFSLLSLGGVVSVCSHFLCSTGAIAQGLPSVNAPQRSVSLQSDSLHASPPEFTDLIIAQQSEAPPESAAQQSGGIVHFLFVNPVLGDDSAAGSTERSPLRSITQALTQARPNTVIMLAPGTYSIANGESFPLLLRSNVILQGNPSNHGNDTLIRGGGLVSTPTFSEQNVGLVLMERSQLVGVTVINPNPNGYGVWIEAGEPVLSSNTFQRNAQAGVAIAGNSTPQVVRNQFFHNQTSGITVYGQARPTLQENQLTDTGTGITIGQQSAPIVHRNHIQNNQDGIVVQASAQPVLRENVIEGNQQNGILAIAQSRPDLGTPGSADQNLIRNNGQHDIQATTPAAIAFLEPNGADSIASPLPATATTSPIPESTPRSLTSADTPEASTTHISTEGVATEDVSTEAVDVLPETESVEVEPVSELVQTSPDELLPVVVSSVPPSSSRIQDRDEPIDEASGRSQESNALALSNSPTPTNSTLNTEGSTSNTERPESQSAPNSLVSAESFPTPSFMSEQTPPQPSAPDSLEFSDQPQISLFMSVPSPESDRSAAPSPSTSATTSLPQLDQDGFTEPTTLELAPNLAMESGINPSSNQSTASRPLPTPQAAEPDAIPIPVLPPNASTVVSQPNLSLLSQEATQPSVARAESSTEPAAIEIPVIPPQTSTQPQAALSTSEMPIPAVPPVSLTFSLVNSDSETAEPATSPLLSLLDTPVAIAPQSDAIEIPVPPPLSHQVSLPFGLPRGNPSAENPFSRESLNTSTQQYDVLPVPSESAPVGNVGDLPTVSVAFSPAQGLVVIPPGVDRARALGLQYRVVVGNASPQMEAQVRSLVPGAFRTRINGQDVIQVGAYGDRANAEQTAGILQQYGIGAVVQPIQ